MNNVLQVAFAVLLSMLLLACTDSDEGRREKVSPENPPESEIRVNAVSISDDGKTLEIAGDNLDMATDVKILSSDKLSVLHELQIKQKSSGLIKASPSGSNLVLADGQILRVK